MSLIQKILFASASILLTTSVYAADFVVSTPTTTTNGGNVVDGSDTLFITSTGSITTTGASNHAVSTTGTLNIINNEGILSANGLNAFGMLIDTGVINTAINNNTIVTSGVNGRGISIATGTSKVVNNGTITILDSGNAINSSGNGNTVINNGVLFMTGPSSTQGLAIQGANSFVVNSGVISAFGAGAGFGVFITSAGNTVLNSGRITLGSSGSTGILLVNGNNNITNTGVIESRLASAIGIQSLVNNNIITNSGRIVLLGAGSSGFTANGLATINNSGKVVSTNAFVLTGSNTLNLLAPGYIGGLINLGTGTAVNITTGPSQSNLWDLSTGTITGGVPTISGPVPAFYNATTAQFATFDPTVFTGSRDELADVSGAASMLIQTRLDNSCCRSSCRGNLWVSGFGSTYKYGSTNATLDYHYKYWGVVAGYDKVIWNNFILGAFAGYGKGFLNSDARFVQSIDNEADGAIMGLYGRQNCGRLFVDLGFSFGNLDHSNSRFVNDNLAPLGESFATSSHNDWWLSPEIAIGANFNKFSCWTISPNARYRYAWESIKSYTEGGSSSNASVSSQNIAIGEFKGEFAAKKTMNCGCVTGRIGYLLRHRLGNLSTNVTMIGQTVSIPLFYNHRNAGYLGLDAEFAIGSCTKFNIGGELTGGGGIKGMKGEMAVVTVF